MLLKPIPMGPDLSLLIEKARNHVMTPDEIGAQRQSWIRGMAPCEHGDADWETCPDCWAEYRERKDAG
jgi:hypothetical protein